MMRKTMNTMIAMLAATTLLAGATAAEARQGMVRVRGANGAATGIAGPRGIAGRAHDTYQSSDGTVTHASGSAFRGANGSRGYRGSSTSVSPDGTVTRSGQAVASGARGSASSAGSFTRSADGTWNGSRSTQATSATTGNSYSGSTTIDPTTGKPVHSGTCTDASGATIPCR